MNEIKKIHILTLQRLPIFKDSTKTSPLTLVCLIAVKHVPHCRRVNEASASGYSEIKILIIRQNRFTISKPAFWMKMHSFAEVQTTFKYIIQIFTQSYDTGKETT